jgi:hypothetical protein
MAMTHRCKDYSSAELCRTWWLNSPSMGSYFRALKRKPAQSFNALPL